MCKRFRVMVVILQGISIISSSALTTRNILLDGTDFKNYHFEFFGQACQKKSYSVENATYYL